MLKTTRIDRLYDPASTGHAHQHETVAQLRNHLIARVAAIQLLFSEVVCYLDTLQVLVPPWITNAFVYGALKRTCAGGIHSWNSQTGMKAIRLHQPSIETVELVTRKVSQNIVTRFDVAVDLVTASQLDAKELQRQLTLILTQPWRGSRQIRNHLTTTYFGAAQTRRNVVVYSDQRSKISGASATHIELRFCRAAACQRRGIYRVKDLLDFDPRVALERDIRFSLVNWKRAEKLIAAKANYIARTSRAFGWRNSFRFAKDSVAERIRYIIRCSASGLDGIPSWHELADLPTQVCVDAEQILRVAAVHLPAHVLIKTQHHLNWFPSN